jgi:hypothetical protein
MVILAICALGMFGVLRNMRQRLLECRKQGAAHAIEATGTFIGAVQTQDNGRRCWTGGDVTGAYWWVN